MSKKPHFRQGLRATAIWLSALAVMAATNICWGVVFTTLDVPGATWTTANDIDSGSIVGSYWDSIDPSHGFLYNGSNYSTLEFPGATVTGATGIDE